MDITRQFLPLGVAVGVGWALCNLTYSAGLKVSSADTQIASLSARLDGALKAADDAASKAREDHDTLTKLVTRDESLEREVTLLQSRFAANPGK